MDIRFEKRRSIIKKYFPYRESNNEDEDKYDVCSLEENETKSRDACKACRYPSVHFRFFPD